MQYYFMILESIIAIYIGIINLNEFKFKIKEIFSMIAIAVGISIPFYKANKLILLIPVMIIPMICIYIKSRDITKSISIPIMACITFIFADNLNECFMTYLIKTVPEEVRNNFNVYWGSLFLCLIVNFIITRFLGHIINKKMRISNMEFKGKISVLIAITLLLTVGINYINHIIQLNNNVESEIIKINSLVFLIYFILLMAIMYILIKNITKEMQTKNKQTELQNLQEYVGNLEEFYTDMRAFRHDYINILSSMVGYIESKDIEGLEKYFNDKITPLGKGMESNNFKIGLLKNIKIPELKGILSLKLLRVQELSIDVFIDIIESIEKIDIDIVDLSRIFEILLDNAIEAAEKCDKPSMKLAIVNKKKSVVIVIVNSVSEEIPIYKIYQKGFSSKGENRGLGLYNLKQIIGKYKNIYMDTIVENGQFKQFIEIINR